MTRGSNAPTTPAPSWTVPERWTLHYRPVTGSTNDDARTLAQQGCADRTIVVADSQSNGRGRLGRSWVATPGSSLLFSLVLRHSLAPILLTAISSLAVVAAIAREASLTAQIKWPNDIMLGDKKVAGVLTEVVSTAGRTATIVGIGLNVNLDLATTGLPDTATSLAVTSGHWHPRAPLLHTILDSIDRFLELPTPQLNSDILANWETHLWRRHQTVRIDDSGATFEGTVLGLSPAGSLRIQYANGTVGVVSVGDLSATP